MEDNEKINIYDIDFDGNIKCEIIIRDNELSIIYAMNGWGNPIAQNCIKIIKIK